MAAEHLLDIYSAVGILLANGKKAVQTGLDCVWSGNPRNGGDGLVYAEQHNHIRDTDIFGDMYAADDTAGFDIQTYKSRNRSASGGSGILYYA